MDINKKPKTAQSMIKRPRTLRSELLIMLSITSLVTLLLVGVILSFVFFGQSYRQAEEDMKFYIESIQKQFTGHMTFVEDAVIFIRGNQEWDNFFREEKVDKIALTKLLEKGVNLFADTNVVKGGHPFVKDFYIFNLQGEAIENHYYPLEKASEATVRERIRENVSRYGKGTAQFSYAKNDRELELYIALYDEELLLKGYCVAIISDTGILQIYHQLEKYKNYQWAVVSQEQQVLSGKDLDKDALRQMRENNDSIVIDRKEFHYDVQKGSFGLTTYILVPKSNLFLAISNGLMMAWLITTSLFLGILWVIFYISKKLSYPLLSIVQKIRQVGKGEFDTKLENYQIQEFQEISTSFNEMTTKINHLIKEVYEGQISLREARIQYLQAQINPHFMFNVLSMIAIRLKRNNDENLYRMVTSFAGLMQGKLFRKDEIEILLADEIEICEFYLYLSSERFRDRVSYRIDWESEDLKECMIPRLCVEPLVENAIIHGLEPKTGNGNIHVGIAKVNEELHITVKDDGIGFDSEQMKRQTDRKSPGIGVMNIQRLIYNLYGENYGADIQSEVGVGTTVRLRLPYSKEKML